MDSLSMALNDLLVNTFYSILHLEEAMLNHMSADQLSINELHMLEAIEQEQGKDECCMSDIAKNLSITQPSVTTAVNKLVKKGYVEKSKSDTDGRLVIVRLSPLGRRAATAHRYFHRHMVENVVSGLSADEKSAIMTGLEKLNAFFRAQENLINQKDSNR